MGDNHSTLSSSTSLNVLAGRGQVDAIINKYKKSDDKKMFIDDMCSCDNVYDMFPINMAIHNSAFKTGIYLMSMGSIYFSNLYTTSYFDNTIHISIEDMDNSLQIPTFTIIIGSKIIHTLDELKRLKTDSDTDSGKSNSELLTEMKPTLLQFSKAALLQNDSQTYFPTKDSCIFAKKMNLLIRQVIEVLETI